ncbi:MAG: HTTM domain-containing protein [Planctomycetes bacterium]|nr:HTTM domain-containing protein [Planctomycetota bacterium]
MSDASTTYTVAGTVPWLPRGLARFGWWTTPVRAEYLAVLRIGIAVTMLYDQLRLYLPHLDALYGPESTGATELWRPAADATVWHWSIFYGLDSNPIHSLALLALSGFTAWLAFRLISCPVTPDGKQDGGEEFRPLLIAWLLAGVIASLGTWSEAPIPGHIRPVPWLLPSVLCVTAWGFLAVRWIRFRRLDGWFVGCGIAGTGLFLSGVALASGEGLHAAVAEALSGWSDDFTFLRAAFYAWILFTLGLGLGLFSRVNAVLVWVLAISFANLNPIVNHGEVAVRNVILFYVMLCPCGAAWSLDRMLLRWRGARSGPVYVAPWPLRLLLIQTVLIYCFTGLFKLMGERWQSGNALYYALADLYYSRMSLAQLGLPPEFLRWTTWGILAWEITFPLWVLLPWTRTAALISGALFHTSTFVLLELGGFDWYMFVLYLPLLPWARWLRDPGFPVVRPQEQTDATAARPAPSGDWFPRFLGWFIVWQLVYLAAANIGGFLLQAVPQSPEQNGAEAKEDSPGLALVRKVITVTDFWGDLSQQPQGWVMYDVVPAFVNLPFLEVRQAVDRPDSPREWKTRVLPSDLQPANLNRYFRFGRPRLTNVEEHVIPPLSDRTDNAEETNQAWAKEIASFVLENQVLIRNYIACRVRHARADSPDFPEPDEVILYRRHYRVNEPGSPTIWNEPEDVPIARWLPGVEDIGRSLQPYNPATRRFETLDVDGASPGERASPPAKTSGRARTD